ncbi:MAG: hypothetical protein ABFD92_11070 [Planctomycetaceae bacterium]|nr:hypothetical protein [Planctomycetaceae bacterium]
MTGAFCRNEAAMYIKDNLEQLRSAAKLAATQHALQSLRIGLILFGGLATLSLTSLGDANTPPPLRLIWIGTGVLGLVMLASGIWFCIHQPRIGLLVGGMLIAAVGLSNIALTAAEAAAGEKLGGGKIFWVIFGLMQFIWGAKLARMYARVGGAKASALPPEMIAWLKDSLKFLGKKGSLSNCNVIQIVSAGPKIWRVSLLPDGALAARISLDREIIVAVSEQIALEELSQENGKESVALRLGPRTLSGTMKLEHIQRFRQWQTALAQIEALPTLSAAPDAPPPLPSGLAPLND